MDNTGSQSSTNNDVSQSSMNIPQNYIIIVLSVLLILALLGVNLFTIFGNVLQDFMNWIAPYINKVFGNLGYNSGNLIDKSGDLVANTAKTGIDLANGAIGNIGDLLMKAGKPLDNSINKASETRKNDEPKDSPSTSPIQNPISSSKNTWCYTGEFEGKRGCVEVSDATRCLSGQLFPNRHSCMNPTKTP